MMTDKFHATHLSDWLAHLENGMVGGHIDMGLSRVEAVRERMGLLPQCPVVVVAGTNGKGSVCAYLTQIYHEAGYKVGTLTSPHLVRFNERIAINGNAVDDSDIVAAFECIEAVRNEVDLTYFEFNTLAAVEIFNRQQVNVMILEVGLGGRLDAVNIFDADVAVITSIDLDHEAYLGNNIEQIALEKAGVMRSTKPIVFGQTTVPSSLYNYALDIGADLLLAGRDFDYNQKGMQQWSYYFHSQDDQLSQCKYEYCDLPFPALCGSFQLNNAACALTVLPCLHDFLPVGVDAIKRGLLHVQHPGRFQVISNQPVIVLDVGHNPHAARALRSSLAGLPVAKKRFAVFSMLIDKDIDSVLDILHDQFDSWFLAPLPLPRGMDIASLKQKFLQHDIVNINCYDHIQQAYMAALSQAGGNDRIVVFGSFHTVAEVMTVASR